MEAVAAPGQILGEYPIDLDAGASPDEFDFRLDAVPNENGVVATSTAAKSTADDVLGQSIDFDIEFDNQQDSFLDCSHDAEPAKLNAEQEGPQKPSHSIATPPAEEEIGYDEEDVAYVPNDGNEQGSLILGESKAEDDNTLNNIPEMGDDIPRHATDRNGVPELIGDDIGKSFATSVNSTPEYSASEEWDEVPNVEVVWDSQNYALFGREDDDEATYFLDDLSLLDRPLSEFLEYLKAVILDDMQPLPHEFELMMRVEPLSLEFGEASRPSFLSRCFREILDCYKNLTANDGNESTLVLSLFSRADCDSRLDYLTDVSMEGLGLKFILARGDQQKKHHSHYKSLGSYSSDATNSATSELEQSAYGNVQDDKVNEEPHPGAASEEAGDIAEAITEAAKESHPSIMSSEQGLGSELGNQAALEGLATEAEQVETGEDVGLEEHQDASLDKFNINEYDAGLVDEVFFEGGIALIAAAEDDEDPGDIENTENTYVEFDVGAEDLDQAEYDEANVKDAIEAEAGTSKGANITYAPVPEAAVEAPTFGLLFESKERGEDQFFDGAQDVGENIKSTGGGTLEPAQGLLAQDELGDTNSKITQKGSTYIASQAASKPSNATPFHDGDHKVHIGRQDHVCGLPTTSAPGNPVALDANIESFTLPDDTDMNKDEIDWEEDGGVEEFVKHELAVNQTPSSVTGKRIREEADDPQSLVDKSVNKRLCT